MGKAKRNSQTVGSIQQKHLQSRISYLYQAATYLAHVRPDPLDSHGQRVNSIDVQHGPSQKEFVGLKQERRQQTPSKAPRQKKKEAEPRKPRDPRNDTLAKLSPTAKAMKKGISPRLLSHLRGISLKSQIRLSPAMKRSICKGCNALLITGSTSTSQVENRSRNGKKPWADILLINCNACGTPKRFPLDAKRQSRKSDRTTLSAQTPQQTGTKEAGCSGF